MMTLNYNEGGVGKTVAVDFVYMGEDINGVWHPTAVQCQMFDPATEDVLSVGSAYTHPKDQFCRKTGRKLAFARAVQLAAFDKATRGKLWAQYLERVKV